MSKKDFFESLTEEGKMLITTVLGMHGCQGFTNGITTLDIQESERGWSKYSLRSIGAIKRGITVAADKIGLQYKFWTKGYLLTNDALKVLGYGRKK